MLKVDEAAVKQQLTAQAVPFMAMNRITETFVSAINMKINNPDLMIEKYPLHFEIRIPAQEFQRLGLTYSEGMDLTVTITEDMVSEEE